MHIITVLQSYAGGTAVFQIQAKIQEMFEFDMGDKTTFI